MAPKVPQVTRKTAGLLNQRLPTTPFQLFLGEKGFPFHHREQDMEPLLVELLPATGTLNISPK
jgi:hypothetical protein